MGDLDNSPTVQITGTIMVIAVIVIFLVVVFVLFLHLYVKWFWWRVEEPAAPPAGRHRRRRRHAFDFTPGQEPAQRGLDPSLLRSLPAVIVQIEDLKDGLECAVCLSEIVQGERARVLPKCNHGFHVECIDMWFHSHSTCPLCRSSVSPHPHSSISAPTASNNEQLLVSGYSSNFPTNALFWGDQTRVSAGAGILEETTCTTDQLPSASSSSRSAGDDDRMLVIDDTPVQMSDSFAEDESKSLTPTRLRSSLKRLLSRDRRMAPSSSTTYADEV